MTACQFDHDMVGAGYYGQTKAGTGGTTTTTTTTTSAAGRGATQGTAGSTTMTGQASAGTKADAAGSGSTSSGTKPSGASGTGAVAAAGTGATPPETTPTDAGTTTTPQAGTGAVAAAGPCDMTGKWLNTVHYVTDALGQLQYAHVYIYLEITQSGDNLMVSKSLHCGDDAVGGGSLAATVDFSKTWQSCMEHVTYTGRTGTSVASGDSCQVDIAKYYVVRGATLPYYLDPSTTLPTSDQKANGDTPGWEDWDGDNNPGITGEISGAVTGKIFVAPRSWTQYSGMVTQADLATMVKLPMTWDQQQNVMSYDGSPFLGTEAARASDATLHFGQFARLTDDQAAGDDAAICASVRSLAPMLTPEAAAAM